MLNNPTLAKITEKNCFRLTFFRKLEKKGLVVKSYSKSTRSVGYLEKVFNFM